MYLLNVISFFFVPLIKSTSFVSACFLWQYRPLLPMCLLLKINPNVPFQRRNIHSLSCFPSYDQIVLQISREFRVCSLRICERLERRFAISFRHNKFTRGKNTGTSPAHAKFPDCPTLIDHCGLIKIDYYRQSKLVVDGNFTVLR